VTTASGKPVIAVSRMTSDERADAELLSRASVRVVEQGASEEALREADGLIAIRPMVVTAQILDQAKRLRAIASMGVGSDHIDVDEATRRGIAVITGGGVASHVVAEYTIGAMIAGHRHFVDAHNRLVAGDPWSDVKRSVVGTSFRDTTLGIVGFGRIGRETARMAQAAFNVTVLYYDPEVPDSCVTFPARRVEDLLSLCEESATLSVHVPLIPGTRHLISEEHLAALGPQGLLVQASRGGVVDEDALVAMLARGQLGGAVVDVFESEPPDRSLIERLAETGRVLLTPHSASSTKRALRDLSWAAVNDLLDFLSGRRPSSVINPV
jgi:phosphoglycerate dehydrogenase-like enzyme